jgi:lactoylglutathione lyase
MRLGYAILYVNDVSATVDFYERAFGFNRRMVKDGDYGELDTGATVLAFAANHFARQITPVPFDAADPSKPAPPVEIGFVTENVGADYRQALAAGAIEVKAPEQKPWGQTVGYIRDLNGFLIEICSPLD